MKCFFSQVQELIGEKEEDISNYESQIATSEKEYQWKKDVSRLLKKKKIPFFPSSHLFNEQMHLFSVVIISVVIVCVKSLIGAIHKDNLCTNFVAF